MESSLITSLVECNGKQNVPWIACSFDEDFILVSEFSELEGPRPVLTIPEDGGASFNKNTFAVRIMSVDCTAPISVEAGRGCDGTFNTVGDTQVVLVEPTEGAVAYVHHFTLYDIHARGFVRPYCMAYITNQQSKIMNNFATFRDHFDRISTYFKFGNAVVFLQDLKNRHEFLNYIRRKLLENVSDKPVGACYELPRDLKGFSFESIKESLKDSAELRDIVLSYLENGFFDEQRAHFNDQYSGLLEKTILEQDAVDNMPSLEELDEKLANLDPRSVGVSSGRKFDTQLRSLDELCSPSKEEAFGLLRNAHFFFRKTKLLEEATLKNFYMDHFTESQLGTNEQVSGSEQMSSFSKDFFLSPRSRCLTGYRPELRRGSEYSGSAPCESGSSFEPGSAWTISSCPSRHDSFEVIKGAQSSSDDEYMSLKDTDSLPSAPPSVISISSSGLADYQPSITTNAEILPGTAKRVSGDTPSKQRHKAASTGTQASYKSDEVDAVLTGSPIINRVSWEDEETTPLEDRNIRDVNRNDHDQGITIRSTIPSTMRQTSIASNGSNRSSSSNTSSSKASKSTGKVQTSLGSRTYSRTSIASASSKESVPSSSSNVFDMPAEICDNVHGISLMKLGKVYYFFPHLIYSLMIGRPVVIIADKSNKSKVHSLIVSLLPCIPGFPRNKDCVIFWTKGPFLISNLATVRLIGLAKIRGHDAVSKSVSNYVTVLDLENSTLLAPHYQGTYLNALFDSQKDWPEAAFNEAFRAAQLELSSQAFMMFAWEYMGSDINTVSNRYDSRRMSTAVPYMKIDPLSFMLSKFSPSDVKIIKQLVEVFKEELLQDYVKSISSNADEKLEEECARFSCIDHTGRLSHSETPSVKLNLIKCTLFSNVGKKKS